MTDADCLRSSFVSVEVNKEFSEAVVLFTDGTSLSFYHKVGERTAKSTGGGDTNLAAKLLARIALFRLNAKHLDVQFADGSRWECIFGA